MQQASQEFDRVKIMADHGIASSNLTMLHNGNGTPDSIMPTTTYGNPKSPVALRIATGGSGQNGLLRALVEEFIRTYHPLASDTQCDRGH